MRMVSILSLTFLASLSPPALTASEVPGSAMPSIGPWLLDKKGEPAHWLGHSFQGKKLFEPINVVFIDSFSSTAEEAQAKLFRAVDRAGYGLEIGHSCGYHAFIGQKLFPQIPPKDGTAFSNAEAFLTNNHGRIMGPLQFGKEFVFVGGFSRESFHLFTADHHQFVSFNAARDDFGAKVAKTGEYDLQNPLDLGNRLNDPFSTTADHDGKLVVLRATR